LKVLDAKYINHPAVVGLGIATLCSASLAGPLISSGHVNVYHLDGHASAMFLPVGLDVCLLWLAATGLLWLGRRYPRIKPAIWGVLLLVFPTLLLKNWATFSTFVFTHRTAFVSFGLPAMAIFTVWRRGGSAAFLHAQEFASTILGFVSPLGVLMLLELAWFGWQARTLNETPRLHERREIMATVPHRPRVVWILLDELSFSQVYEARYPGLSLPAFDELAATATVFTHTVPAGDSTDLVVRRCSRVFRSTHFASPPAASLKRFTIGVQAAGRCSPRNKQSSRTR
jgi:hypothetical protein